MPLVAPTIVEIIQTREVGPLTLLTDYVTVQFFNTGSGDHNRIFRSHPAEYGGQFICIADPVTWSTDRNNTVFQDYGVANGRSYSYYLEAVDGGGATSASAPQPSPVVELPRAVLHTVAKNYQPTSTSSANGINAVRFLDGSVNATPAQGRQYRLAAGVRLGSNASLPRIGIGSIEQIQISPQGTSLYGTADIRSSIRTVYRAAGYTCFRDLNGNKWFGKLRPPQERYNARFADLGLTLEVLSVSEDVRTDPIFPVGGFDTPGARGPLVEEDVVLLSSIVVDSSVGTKQALYTVPVGNSALPHYVIVRSPTVSLAGMSDVLSFGFDAGASDYQNEITSTQLALLTSSTKATGTTFLSPDSSGAIPIIGAAGDVFGCKFHDTGITSNVTIEVWGALF